MGRNRLFSTILLLISVCSLLVPSMVAAQDDAPADAGTPASGTPDAGAVVQIVLRPDGGLDAERLVVEANPGENKTLAVYIGSLGADPLRVVSYTADISTRINGGLQIAERGAEQSEPTSWIDFPDEEVTIEPGKELRREFPLLVPEGTDPGEYVIPIAVETLDAFAVPGSDQLLQKVRKIITIYVTVPGDLKAEFSLGDPVAEYLGSRLVVDVPLTNSGDTTLRLGGDIQVKDATGTTLIDQPVTMGAFYRGDETRVRLTIGGVGLPPGDYQVSLNLTDSLSGVNHQIENQTLAVPEPPSNELIPLEFQNIIILPNADPIQFAGVGVDVANNAEVLRDGRLILVVEKDGQPLEEFPLAENLTLNQGVTTITQRYLPLAGWESGTYTFSLRLESVDSTSGSVQVLLTGDDVATIEVP